MLRKGLHEVQAIAVVATVSITFQATTDTSETCLPKGVIE